MSRHPAVADYLDRLRDLLPSATADEVVREVESLIEDRLEQAEGGAQSPEAVARALAALGPPETLAGGIAGGSVSIPLATRRSFVRLLAAVFAAHLLLAIVLAVVGAETLVPGLVVPLPTGSAIATVAGILGVLFTDAGLLLVLFAILGRERAPAWLPRIHLRMPGTRRDAVLSIVLVLLVGAILYLPSLRDVIFALGGQPGTVREPILSPAALGLLPYAYVFLGLLLVRHVVLLVTGGEGKASVAADALSSLAGAALAALVLVSDSLVLLPRRFVDQDAAAVFQDLLSRAFLVVAFVAGVALAIRFAKRVLRLRELIVSG